MQRRWVPGLPLGLGVLVGLHLAARAAEEASRAAWRVASTPRAFRRNSPLIFLRKILIVKIYMPFIFRPSCAMQAIRSSITDESVGDLGRRLQIHLADGAGGV
jgi:hypothetical protein